MTTFRRPTRVSFRYNDNTTEFEQSLMIRRKQKQINESLMWLLANALILAFICYEISAECLDANWYLQLGEFIGGIILSLNICHHMIRCLYLQLSDNDIPDAPRNPPPVAEVTRDTTNGSFSQTTTASSSWMYFNNVQTPPRRSYVGTPTKASPSLTPLSSSSVPSNISDVETIEDEKSLNKYLADYEAYERKNSKKDANDTKVSSGIVKEMTLSPIWGNEMKKIVKKEQSSPTLRCHYQMATTPPTTAASTGGQQTNDKSGQSPLLHAQSLEMWRQLNVNSVAVMQWNENLRVWLSKTILERLVREFNTIDLALRQSGFCDVAIGAVGLDRLRKTAEMEPILELVPTLSVIIPFLELTTNQEYLVHRIRELSIGGCMSEFKWNGGSSYAGKEWEITLPTDSAIVMHLFANYMDTQLLPQPNRPEAKPFTGFHFLRVADNAMISSDLDCGRFDAPLLIQELSVNPPHYRVIVGERIYETVKGYNNLFHSILLFLYFVNKRENGMLGMINLGNSGLNLLWIIDS